MKRSQQRQKGSALVWTILTVTVLSVVAAELLLVVSRKYYNTLHTATWQEALLAAESGVDLAIVELRKSLYPAPNSAWEGWTSAPGNGVTGYGLSTIPNAGLAGTPMTIEVRVDAPPELRDPANSWQYYRIRTTGTMPITGPTRNGDDKRDSRLRKLSLRWDRFTENALVSQAVATPRVSRRLEAIVRPVSAFDQAIVSLTTLDLTDHNIIIDSYDSRDPLKSTNGLYDANKRQHNGSIATNGNLINAGNAHIYGNVSTNAGTVSGAANITGTVRTDFYQDPIPVGAPNWPSINPSPMVVNNTTSLAASATEGAASSRYVLSGISLSGNQVLTLSGAADGSTTHIEVYVTGNVDVTGNGQIILAPGVKAKLYFAGNVKVAGNGLVNKNNQPGDLLMYGINPSGTGTTRSIDLAGNALLSAAVYAPAFDVKINNPGNKGSAFGSFVGKTVKMDGITDFHYDEALGAGGTINNYKIVSWFEDTR